MFDPQNDCQQTFSLFPSDKSIPSDLTTPRFKLDKEKLKDAELYDGYYRF